MVVVEEDSAVDMVEEAAEVTGVEVTAEAEEDMEEEVDMVAVIMEDEEAVATEEEEDLVEEEDSGVIVEVRKI